MRYFASEPPLSIDSNGQLSIFFDHSYEAPEPDDYKSITEYEAPLKQWQQDELKRQEFQTNILNESKNLAPESHVIDAKKFIRDSVKYDTYKFESFRIPGTLNFLSGNKLNWAPGCIGGADPSRGSFNC